jgi:hypothetical protein
MFALSALVSVRGDLNAMVMGDWGGIPIPPWTTPAEQETAKYMDEEVAKINAKFCLALGDNFYENGITTNEYDLRFNKTFEEVFSGPNLQAPGFFKVLAGNHDHYGNVTAQVEYSKHNPRWHFPSLYYNWVEQIDATTTVEFVQLDTVLLSGNSRDPVTGRDLDGDEMPGPADQAAADAEWAWINKTLSASTADFIVAAGHFPVWSVCEHGPTGNLVQRLKPILDYFRVSAYLSGHDHCEEHIDDSNGLGPQYHVIGAANQNGGSHKHKDSVPTDQVKFLDIGTLPGISEFQAGFASLNFVGGATPALTVKHYRGNPSSYKVMYTAPPIHKRGPPAAPTLAPPTP